MTELSQFAKTLKRLRTAKGMRQNDLNRQMLDQLKKKGASTDGLINVISKWETDAMEVSTVKKRIEGIRQIDVILEAHGELIQCLGMNETEDSQTKPPAIQRIALTLRIGKFSEEAAETPEAVEMVLDWFSVMKTEIHDSELKLLLEAAKAIHKRNKEKEHET